MILNFRKVYKEIIIFTEVTFLSELQVSKLFSCEICESGQKTFFLEGIIHLGGRYM